MTVTVTTAETVAAIPLTVRPEHQKVELAAASVALVGFSGRDVAAVEAHILELVELGMPRPDATPAVWTVPRQLVVAASSIAASPQQTSGEAEPVLIRIRGEWLLGVGSDHTDRELERADIARAKLACHKVISTHVWRLRDVAARWDDLILSSRIRLGADWLPYQHGGLQDLRPVEWFIDRFAEDTGDCVVFCGTIATVSGLVTGSTGFRAELADPATGDVLSCEYTYAAGG
jgi:hypothetical protein